VSVFGYACSMAYYMARQRAGRELKSIIGAWPSATFGLKYYNYKRTP